MFHKVTALSLNTLLHQRGCNFTAGSHNCHFGCSTAAFLHHIRLRGVSCLNPRKFIIFYVSKCMSGSVSRACQITVLRSRRLMYNTGYGIALLSCPATKHNSWHDVILFLAMMLVGTSKEYHGRNSVTTDTQDKASRLEINDFNLLMKTSIFQDTSRQKSKHFVSTSDIRVHGVSYEQCFWLAKNTHTHTQTLLSV